MKVLNHGSWVIWSNFSNSEGEGPQKSKKLHFSTVHFEKFWIKMYITWWILSTNSCLIFKNDVFSSKYRQKKGWVIPESQNFQNSFWRLNSTYFSDWKTLLDSILGFKMTEFKAIYLKDFWGPSPSKFEKLDQITQLPWFRTFRTT